MIHLCTRFKDTIKFNFIYWIRFEVLFNANIKRYISRVNFLDKFKLNVQGKYIWLRLLLVPKL